MAKVRNPWLKFYPQDWRGDAKLRSCSIGARGLWIEMVCIMHEADPYGHLLLGGVPVANQQLAQLAGISTKECLAFIMELQRAGVFSRSDTGIVFSRRMVRDHERSAKGRADAERRWNRDSEPIGDPNATPIGDPNRVPKGDPITLEARSQSDDAGATRAGPSITPEAAKLTEQLLVIAGHNPAFWPPGWCGAPMRVQAWISSGWSPEIITIAVTAAVAKRRGPPVSSVQFFENAILEEIARQGRPIPTIETNHVQTTGDQQSFQSHKPRGNAYARIAARVGHSGE